MDTKELTKKEIQEQLKRSLHDLNITRQRIERHAANIGVHPAELKDQVGRFMLEPILSAEIIGLSALLNSMNE